MKIPRSRSVLLVVPGLDPVGTGRQLEIVAVGLRAAGWNVQLAVTTPGGSLPLKLEQKGFVVHRCGTRPNAGLAVAAALLRLVKASRPAVIYCWGRSQSRLVGAIKIFLPNVRLLSHLARMPRGLATAWALRQADGVIAISPGVQQACQRLGVAAAVIPPGIDLALGDGLTREQIAASLGLEPTKIWTLCVAPLKAQSRLEHLLWAIDQLGVVNRDLEHVLVGSGPLRERICRRACVQQLAERLHLRPHCNCLPDLLQQVRFVWQSGRVAYGGAILDAMAQGVASVAVSSDAARQLIVPNETGCIVAADPESEFPRRALGVLEDDALAARYGAAARVRATEHFPTTLFLASHTQALEQVIA